MTQLIYGIHSVQEALQSSLFQFEKIFVGTDTLQPRLQTIIDLAHQRRLPVVFTTKEGLDRMVKGGFHQNIVGLIKGIPYADLEETLSRWRHEGAKAFFIVLDGLQDPQNFGSLIRTAVGCGVHGMIIPKDRAVGITPVVIRASAGAIAHLPIVRVVNIASTLETLKGEGIWVYGAAGEADAPIYQIDFTGDVAIVVGSEGKGIRPLVKKKCDQLFSIPMKGPVSSFNASVSGGMILYEVMRQRHIMGKS
jgi:23S rRNA (guanosine2251-2'-O)-methyltransferase